MWHHHWLRDNGRNTNGQKSKGFGKGSFLQPPMTPTFPASAVRGTDVSNASDRRTADFEGKGNDEVLNVNVSSVSSQVKAWSSLVP